MSKTWFITGASRGFGRAWTVAALERGDRVAATARDTRTLDDLAARFGDALLPLRLDVDDRAAGTAAVQDAHRHFGRLDVVVNNAGFGHFGAIEEVTEDEARAQLETNFFGALWITQAALPLLREQGGGHIVQISSIGGVMALPGLGIYNASKWALEAFSEALAAEVAPFGIRTTLIEPSGFATDWAGASAHRSEPNPLYQPIRDRMAHWSSAGGVPEAEDSVEAMLAAVDAEEPPLRLIFASRGYDMVLAVHEQRMATWRDWEKISRSADPKE
ncbi:SDR family oxidoreductase [Myceligenerans pegani]|uniref:SDR family oxidoreductase n=1 Tax=Myceligenerans pegani TaxID=2776917 RepID=A0ABR9N5L7_9MICO|nr:SDR family oxidoreductase [Myceligenerans sp. TRM 65318]MBE1878287.1 SDR family oxidoreductase [Myceligenerans sp. TRM 65318]MBE3020558.1 SDR family oxidoreductase [Myceligenerans sp. TRM 65318]